MAEVSTNSGIPENQFRPNDTLEATEPIPGEERVQHDEEDNAGGANLDEGFDDFRNPEGPTPHETDQITPRRRRRSAGDGSSRLATRDGSTRPSGWGTTTGQRSAGAMRSTIWLFVVRSSPSCRRKIARCALRLPVSRPERGSARQMSVFVLRELRRIRLLLN